MIKARATLNGRDTVMIGLSYNNLASLRADAGDAYMRIVGSELGLPMDIVIFSGKDEDTLVDLLVPGINAATKICIEPSRGS